MSIRSTGLALLGATALASIANGAEFEVGLSKFPVQTYKPTPVAMAGPAAGNTITLATLPGVGIIHQIYLVVNDGDLNQNGCLDIYVDGEATPSLSFDLATVFATAGSASTGAGGVFGTKHVQTNPFGGGGPGTLTGAMSGTLAYPIPYGNGCIVKLRAPAAGTSTGANSVFMQLQYRQGAVSKYRLRSSGVTWLSKQTYGPSDQIVFSDIQNCAGSLVYHGLVAQGSNMSYLERCQWVARDGEPEVLDASGMMNTSFRSSGGEDLFGVGWYFGDRTQVNTPNAFATQSNGSDHLTCAGFDFLSAFGGLPFTNRLRMGWSLKNYNVITTGHTQAFTNLYYVDTSVPFVPTVVQNVTAVATGSNVSVSWTPPAYIGSGVVTGYVVTAQPGNVVINAPASATSAAFTGLTNGTAYTFSVQAVNSAGLSPIASATATPSTPLMTWDFTKATLPSGVTATGGANGTATNAAGNVVAVSAPRFTYSAGICKGILNEAAATNLILQSSALATSPWTTYNSGVAAPVVTNNAATSPDGTADASSIAFPAWAASGTGPATQVSQTIATTVGATYTEGLWFKGNGGEKICLFAQQAATPYNVLASQIITLTNGWKFYPLTFTATSSATQLVFGQSGAIPGNTTQPAQTIFAWGTQIEAGAVATSTITTTTAPVTRSADAISGTIPSGVGHLTVTYGDGTQSTLAVSPGAYTLAPVAGKPVVSTVVGTA